MSFTRVSFTPKEVELWAPYLFNWFSGQKWRLILKFDVLSTPSGSLADYEVFPMGFSQPLGGSSNDGRQWFITIVGKSPKPAVLSLPVGLNGLQKMAVTNYLPPSWGDPPVAPTWCKFPLASLLAAWSTNLPPITYPPKKKWPLPHDQGLLTN